MDQDHGIKNEMLFKARAAGSLYLGLLNGDCSGVKLFWFYQSSTLAGIPSDYNKFSLGVQCRDLFAGADLAGRKG